jgi:hypothetical protein
MYYDVKRLPDAPVVIGTWYDGFKFVEQGLQYARETNALLSEQKTPVFYVLDLSMLHTVSIEGVLKSAESGANSATSNLRHPMNRGNIIVSKAALVKLAAKGMNTATFGNIDIKLFETLHEALEYVKRES